MDNNTKVIKEVIEIIELERNNLMDIRESFSVLNFLLKEPELIQNNLELLYGLKNIVLSNSLILNNMHDNLDLSIKLQSIKV